MISIKDSDVVKSIYSNKKILSDTTDINYIAHDMGRGPWNLTKKNFIIYVHDLCINAGQISFVRKQNVQLSYVSNQKCLQFSDNIKLKILNLTSHIISHFIKLFINYFPNGNHFD